ncbi:hypothetical protein VTK73DRAFT_10182 [Phialemonium thermophilum]|uniref:Uncharacterized protein n=1 Tax=Phialemonium thermophilum TaxID=223376 RepID=A0ABR3VYD1_9PEZI
MRIPDRRGLAIFKVRAGLKLCRFFRTHTCRYGYLLGLAYPFLWTIHYCSAEWARCEPGQKSGLWDGPLARKTLPCIGLLFSVWESNLKILM